MTSALALCGAAIAAEGRMVEAQAVVLEGGTITAVVPEREIPGDVPRQRLEGGILSAGFIDTQVNGGGGVQFNEAPDLDALRVIGAAHRRFGTTGFLPTVISDELAVIDKAMRTVERAMAERVPGVHGIHIEGPMLSPARKGIHDARHFRTADRAMLDIATSLQGGRTVVTLAPEIVGEEAISHLSRAGVIVSAGHTEATYETMLAGFAAGMTGVTHLFNAMTQLGSRAPGAVGAALENAGAWCGVILDGVHVHPGTMRLALRCHPVDRFMLVTDAMSPVGTDATSFLLQGRTIAVTPKGCIDEKGTLAGSNLTMSQAVRNAVDLAGLSLPVALGMASTSPAAFLGMEEIRGAIRPGMAADLVWLDENRKVGATWIAGRESWEGERP